jgi:hypothetical protein
VKLTLLSNGINTARNFVATALKSLIIVSYIGSSSVLTTATATGSPPPPPPFASSQSLDDDEPT